MYTVNIFESGLINETKEFDTIDEAIKFATSFYDTKLIYDAHVLENGHLIFIVKKYIWELLTTCDGLRYGSIPYTGLG